MRPTRCPHRAQLQHSWRACEQPSKHATHAKCRQHVAPPGSLGGGVLCISGSLQRVLAFEWSGIQRSVSALEWIAAEQWLSQPATQSQGLSQPLHHRVPQEWALARAVQLLPAAAHGCRVARLPSERAQS